jgi:excisionase family DNA binding protein
MTNTPIRPLWTVHDVAKYLRLHPNTIYILVKDMGLPMTKVGKSMRFDPEAVQEFFRRNSGMQDAEINDPAEQEKHDRAEADDAMEKLQANPPASLLAAPEPLPPQAQPSIVIL